LKSKVPSGVLRWQSPDRWSGRRSTPEAETLLLNEHAIFDGYLTKNLTAHMTSFQKFLLHFLKFLLHIPSTKTHYFRQCLRNI